MWSDFNITCTAQWFLISSGRLMRAIFHPHPNNNHSRSYRLLFLGPPVIKITSRVTSLNFKDNFWGVFLQEGLLVLHRTTLFICYHQLSVKFDFWVNTNTWASLVNHNRTEKIKAGEQDTAKANSMSATGQDWSITDHVLWCLIPHLLPVMLIPSEWGSSEHHSNVSPSTTLTSPLPTYLPIVQATK